MTKPAKAMKKRRKRKVAVYRQKGQLLLTQTQAAAALNVSTRYLRNSDCPKLFLPGNGRTGQPVLRYDLEQCVAWARAFDTGRAA